MDEAIVEAHLAQEDALGGIVEECCVAPGRENAPCAATRACSCGLFLRARVLLPDVMKETLIETSLPSPIGWDDCVFLEHSLQAGKQH